MPLTLTTHVIRVLISFSVVMLVGYLIWVWYLKPVVESMVLGLACTDNGYSCGEWGPCQDGKQRRICTPPSDKHCASNLPLPETVQDCTKLPTPSSEFVMACPANTGHDKPLVMKNILAL